MNRPLKTNLQSPPMIPAVGRRKGSVLIIVLWISFGLVSIALMFGHSMMMEFRASDNAYAGAQAQQAIDGAERYAGYLLSNLEEPGTLPDLESYPTERVPLGEADFWFLGRDVNSSYHSMTPYYGLVDEGSKLNLNTATQEMLEALPGMTTELAAAIIDWRDEDDEVTEGGAESNSYQFQTPAYQAKNAKFETVDELRLVLGAYPEILYGEDANLNGILDPNENDGDVSPPPDDRDGVLRKGILEYVTVYSCLSTNQNDGSARINIAGESQQELTTLLQETFGQSRANEIQQQVNSLGTNVTSVVQFYIRSGMTANELAQIEDQLIVGAENQEGLVNINTASKEVLTCIPGIGQENVDRVVSYRTANRSKLNSVAWITEVLDEENAIEAGPYITGRSHQMSADIVAVGHHGKGYRRARYVIDTNGEKPVVLYKRDLSGLGWALSPEVRQQLALNNPLRN